MKATAIYKCNVCNAAFEVTHPVDSYNGEIKCAKTLCPSRTSKSDVELVQVIEHKESSGKRSTVKDLISGLIVLVVVCAKIFGLMDDISWTWIVLIALILI